MLDRGRMFDDDERVIAVQRDGGLVDLVAIQIGFDDRAVDVVDPLLPIAYPDIVLIDPFVVDGLELIIELIEDFLENVVFRHPDQVLRLEVDDVVHEDHRFLRCGSHCGRREDEFVLAAPAGQRDGRLADDEAIIAVAAQSGNAFHLDLSATKFLSKELSVGVIASHYQQVTGDSGEGATLGPYKGRTTALGGTVGYTFEVGKIPVSTRVKVLREVDVENRFQGTIGFLQISFPLWVAPAASPLQAVVAKY